MFLELSCAGGKLMSEHTIITLFFPHGLSSPAHVSLCKIFQHTCKWEPALPADVTYCVLLSEKSIWFSYLWQHVLSKAYASA